MFAIFVLFVVSFADLTLQAEWSYSEEGSWPGVCTTGMQQSPINIMTRDAVVDKHQAHIRGPLVFRGYNNVELYAINNGHTLFWEKDEIIETIKKLMDASDDYPKEIMGKQFLDKLKTERRKVKWAGVSGGSAPVLSGGPLRGNYTFLQFHFHWLSEHAIDGMKYPLEVHMVHIKTGLTIDEAFQRSDGLAVIGVFFMVHRNYESEYALEQLIPMVPYITDSSMNKTESYKVDVTRLLSHEPQSYYTYHGSLTTPLCQEVVTWIVMDKPVFITSEQYKMFAKVDVGGDYNYRSLQQSNNRVVYRSISSCASILAPTVPGTLLGLLSCLSSTLGAGFNKGIGAVMNVKRKLFGDTVKKCVKLN